MEGYTQNLYAYKEQGEEESLSSGLQVAKDIEKGTQEAKGWGSPVPRGLK